MKIILPLLCCLAIGLLVWALMPPDVERVSTPRAGQTARGAAPVADAPRDDTEDDDRAAPTARPGAAPTAARPATAAPATARPAPDLRAPVVPLPEGEYRTAAQGGAGRTPDMPMPRTTASALKDPLRRYYGNLPRTGRMPARIAAEEILPESLIIALGVPPESQVVELGHHPMTGPEGFEEALAIEGPHPVMLGVTVVTPDGQRIRDYVQVAPDDMPPE